MTACTPEIDQTATDFTSTHMVFMAFEAEARAQISEVPASSNPESPVPPASLSAPRPTPVPGLVSGLSLKASRGKVSGWWLYLPEEQSFALSPYTIVGAVVRTAKGKTSPIAAFDPLSKRIMTRSGSVYELGMPDIAFAAKGRIVLRCLGF